MMVSGTTYALLTAACWAVAVVLFKKSGEVFSPIALNAFKNLVALALLALTLLVTGSWSPAPWTHHAALLASGALGIGVADTLFFKSLNLLGAARQAIVDCSYSPVIVLLSYVILHERLAAVDAIGALLIIAAVGLVVVRRGEQTLPPKQLLTGVACGVAAMASMGISIVAVKPLLEVYDVVSVTVVRLLGGIAVLAIVALVHAPSRAELRVALRPQPAWRFAVPGAIMGNYFSLLFWIAGFKYEAASVASILNQTTTLFIVLLAAVFLREPLTLRGFAAVLLGVAGSALVLV